MTMPKNYLKQVYLYNEPFSSNVALRICLLTHLVCWDRSVLAAGHFQRKGKSGHTRTEKEIGQNRKKNTPKPKK
jgi:hypothetical protein